MKQGYNLALERSRARVQKEAELMRWLGVHQKRVNEIFKRARLAAEAVNDGLIYIETRPAAYAGASHTVFVSFSIHQLQGLKDPKLETALTPFLDANESRCVDYAQALNRDYKFIYKLDGGEFEVMVSAYVAEENPTCRKILVRREVVPTVQEVFALSCDGDVIEAAPVLPKLVDVDAQTQGWIDSQVKED